MVGTGACLSRRRSYDLPLRVQLGDAVCGGKGKQGTERVFAGFLGKHSVLRPSWTIGESMKKMSPILAIGFAASIAFTVSVAQAQNNQAAPAQVPTSATTQNGTPATELVTEKKTASSNKPAHHPRVAAHYRHHHRYGASYGAYAYFGSRYRYRSSADNERRCMLSPGSLNYVPCTNKW